MQQQVEIGDFTNISKKKTVQPNFIELTIINSLTDTNKDQKLLINAKEGISYITQTKVLNKESGTQPCTVVHLTDKNVYFVRETYKEIKQSIQGPCPHYKEKNKKH